MGDALRAPCADLPGVDAVVIIEVFVADGAVVHLDIGNVDDECCY